MKLLRRIPASQWSEMKTAYASGIGLRELARNMGVPEGTVLARAQREGWTRQIRDAKALVASPTASTSPETSVTAAVAFTMQERGLRHQERVASLVEKTLPAVEALEPLGVLDRVDDLDRLDKIGRRTFGLDEPGSGVVRVSIYSGEQPVCIEIEADVSPIGDSAETEQP